MPLTDIQIRKALPREKAYKKADGGGLYMFVTPKGSRLWRMKYRVNGKERTLSIGAYPDTSLANARKARDQAREQLAAGLDPSALKQEAKAKVVAEIEDTFASVAAEYLEKNEREGRAKTTMKKKRAALAKAIKAFGSVPVCDVTAPMILKLLKKEEDRGVYETAHRLRTYIGEVMRYAVATARAQGDPTVALKGALVRPQRKNHAAIIHEGQFAELMRAIDNYVGHASTRIALKLMALLYPRSIELRQATWDEIDFGEKVWEIPASRMKMRRPHRIPLPDQAVTLFRDQQAMTGNMIYVFPAVHSAVRHMSENTLNVALRRMGYTKEEMTCHGFRASFTTFANEARLWHPDAIERALAHKERNQVRAAYVRGDHWEERVKMADWWAEKLDGMLQASLMES